MRILLPPSETKRNGTLPGPLQLESLVAPELAAARTRVVAALARRSATPTPAARAAIGVTAAQDAELARNANLLQAPVAPAYAVYDGVLFDAIDLDSCPPREHQRIVERTLVQSALFGIVGFGDHIPAYRCSADSTLPRLGRIGTYWKQRLAASMEQLVDGHCVIDMRSGPYAAMWVPRPDTAARTVVVKVMQERGVRRLAVSHFNKATKGQLARALAGARRELMSPEDVAEAATMAGFDVALVDARPAPVLEVLMR